MRACLVLALAACGGGGAPTAAIECGAGTMASGALCVPVVGPSCGAGTHEVDGACIGDARFEVRATPTIRADGWTATEIRVFGTNGDGSPSHDAVVLSVDRSSAGALVSPAFTLDDLGGATNFVPCGAAPDCAGAARISVALASAPLQLLAHVDVQLVAPPPIGSADPCLGGGNVLYFDGANFDYDGPVSFSTSADHLSAAGADDRVRVEMVSDAGDAWALSLSTQQLGIDLIPSVYDNAMEPTTSLPGQPGFSLIGNGTVSTSCATVASFEVREFAHLANPDLISVVTATFEVTCQDDSTRRLTGCVHFAQ